MELRTPGVSGRIKGKGLVGTEDPVAVWFLLPRSSKFPCRHPGWRFFNRSRKEAGAPSTQPRSIDLGTPSTIPTSHVSWVHFQFHFHLHSFFFFFFFFSQTGSLSFLSPSLPVLLALSRVFPSCLNLATRSSAEDGRRWNLEQPASPQVEAAFLGYDARLDLRVNTDCRGSDQPSNPPSFVFPFLARPPLFVPPSLQGRTHRAIQRVSFFCGTVGLEGQ